MVATLQRAAADPETRGPLAGLLHGDGQFDLLIPPAELVRTPKRLLCALGTGVRETEARAVGIVLPVRTLWGEDAVCDYLDAEAVVLVAAEKFGPGLASVGLRCALHELPHGWEEAHADLQEIAAPLRHALAAAS